MPELRTRLARASDLPRLLEIYNHYVVHTAVTFDLEPVTLAARQAWLTQFGRTGRHQLWVAEWDEQVLGYAASQQFRAKAAYASTVETSIYCAPEACGRGVGRALYTALFAGLAREDIRTYIAAVTLPNQSSVELHVRFGFTPVGVMRGVGRKLGAYWDVAWFEKRATASA